MSGAYNFFTCNFCGRRACGLTSGSYGIAGRSEAIVYEAVYGASAFGNQGACLARAVTARTEAAEKGVTAGGLGGEMGVGASGGED